MFHLLLGGVMSEFDQNLVVCMLSASQ